uniref:C3H1-type domain-containing protein n=1 Tax=Strombidium rassoulzadegani TaxID=1082188 RepID=A0A7S3CKJ3_9SPIT|mmetsp:Transcript_14592/g.24891  ORF Transcript_14592/g.24891 Transcript_14592/m.24891 type:complete len:298 (+) Transcript_14592:1339-2232(+)
MCKNFELYGKCKYGDECSFAHTRGNLMIKSDVSALYKTKHCKKYSTTGYCPYGVRCQFIHEHPDAPKSAPALAQKVFAKPIEKIPAFVPSQTKPVAKPLTTEALKAEVTFKPKKPVEPVASKEQVSFLKKQTHLAINEENLKYKEVLVHCLNVTIQEHQKKKKMYEKKVQKKKYEELIPEPGIQYMNLYSNRVKRLSCFQRITNLESADDEEEEYGSENEELAFNSYSHGDAKAYEAKLDRLIKQLSQESHHNQGYYPDEPMNLMAFNKILSGDAMRMPFAQEVSKQDSRVHLYSFE